MVRTRIGELVVDPKRQWAELGGKRMRGWNGMSLLCELVLHEGRITQAALAKATGYSDSLGAMHKLITVLRKSLRPHGLNIVCRGRGTNPTYEIVETTPYGVAEKHDRSEAYALEGRPLSLHALMEWIGPGIPAVWFVVGSTRDHLHTRDRIYPPSVSDLLYAFECGLALARLGYTRERVRTLLDVDVLPLLRPRPANPPLLVLTGQPSVNGLMLRARERLSPIGRGRVGPQSLTSGFPGTADLVVNIDGSTITTYDDAGPGLGMLEVVCNPFWQTVPMVLAWGAVPAGTSGALKLLSQMLAGRRLAESDLAHPAAAVFGAKLADPVHHDVAPYRRLRPTEEACSVADDGFEFFSGRRRIS